MTGAGTNFQNILDFILSWVTVWAAATATYWLTNGLFFILRHADCSIMSWKGDIGYLFLYC